MDPWKSINSQFPQFTGGGNYNGQTDPLNKWDTSKFVPYRPPEIVATHLKSEETSHSRKHMDTNIPFRLLEMAKNLQLGQAKDNNFVFSPSSIHIALSLLANGSKGSTLEELLAFLEAKDLNHLNSVAKELIESLMGSTQGGPSLAFVGGAWIDQSFILNPTFKTMAQDTYQAKAQTVDFEHAAERVTHEVNKWAEEITNGLIKSVLTETLEESTWFVLANALYFKGKWTTTAKFDESRTRNSNFYLLDGTSVNVPFMTNHVDQYIRILKDFKVLRLPYEQSTNAKSWFSMYIILPAERDGLWALVEKVGSDPLFLKSYVRPYGEKVEVGNFKVPKFKMNYKFDGCEVLNSIGLKLPFSNAAEFDEMVLNLKLPLKVTKIIHKSQIEVNEEGTEAAAVTVLAGMFGSAAPSMFSRPFFVDFVADHPFLLIVRDDKSGMVLFMGHVIDPSL